MKKTLLAFLIAALDAIPAQAQIFRPAVVQGAVLGGVAGALSGPAFERPAGTRDSGLPRRLPPIASRSPTGAFMRSLRGFTWRLRVRRLSK